MNSQTTQHKGSCLCGAIRFEVEGELEHHADACHCGKCRKQTGHIFVSTNVKRSALRIHDGQNKLTWYWSSDKVRRGFCSVCGSALFWEPSIEGYEYLAITMGAFDTPTGKQLAKHIFVAEKGDYYEIADGLPQHKAY